MSGQNVTLRAANGGEFTAFLTEPAGCSRSMRAPAVLVLQEIFGVNAFVRGVCDRLADAGFIAIAPDLFWRQEAGIQLSESDLERALLLLEGLDQKEAISDCSDAVAYVRALPNCSGRVGTVGYCLGGKLAYLMAMRSKVAAAVSYYGVGIEGVLNEANVLTSPLLLHVAADDTLCPPQRRRRSIEPSRTSPALYWTSTRVWVMHSRAAAARPTFHKRPSALMRPRWSSSGSI